MAAITFSVDTPLYVSGLVIGRGIDLSAVTSLAGPPEGAIAHVPRHGAWS